MLKMYLIIQGGIFWLFIIIICTNINDVNPWRMFKLNYTYINVYGNPAISTARGAIRFNSEGHSVIDIFFTPKIKIFGPFFFNVEVRTITKNVHLPIKINTTVNLCDPFKDSRIPPIVRGVYTGVISHMDMPLKCPIEPRLYSMIGAGVAEEGFPPYTPFAAYKVVVRLYQPREDPYSILCTAHLKVDVIRNNERRPSFPGKKKF